MKKVFLFLSVLVASLSLSDSVHSMDRFDRVGEALARPIVSYNEAELLQELEYLTNPQKEAEDRELDDLLANLPLEASQELNPYAELELWAAEAEKKELEKNEMIDKMMASFILVSGDGVDLNYSNNKKSFYENIIYNVCYYLNWK